MNNKSSISIEDVKKIKYILYASTDENSIRCIRLIVPYSRIIIQDINHPNFIKPSYVVGYPMLIRLQDDQVFYGENNIKLEIKRYTREIEYTFRQYQNTIQKIYEQSQKQILQTIDEHRKILKSQVDTLHKFMDDHFQGGLDTIISPVHSFTIPDPVFGPGLPIDLISNLFINTYDAQQQQQQQQLHQQPSVTVSPNSVEQTMMRYGLTSIDGSNSINTSTMYAPNTSSSIVTGYTPLQTLSSSSSSSNISTTTTTTTTNTIPPISSLSTSSSISPTVQSSPVPSPPIPSSSQQQQQQSSGMLFQVQMPTNGSMLSTNNNNSNTIQPTISSNNNNIVSAPPIKRNKTNGINIIPLPPPQDPNTLISQPQPQPQSHNNNNNPLSFSTSLPVLPPPPPLSTNTVV